MLELQHISWTAPGGSQVLRDVSVKIPEGKLTVITGPNGGGKSWRPRTAVKSFWTERISLVWT